MPEAEILLSQVSQNSQVTMHTDLEVLEVGKLQCFESTTWLRMFTEFAKELRRFLRIGTIFLIGNAIAVVPSFLLCAPRLLATD